MNPAAPEVVALDGDDTLWHNEHLFEGTQAFLRELVSHHVDGPELDARLLARERANLAVFGYGVKGFTLSMIETAVEVSRGEVTGAEIQSLIDRGRSMLHHPVELLDGVAEAVGKLAERYRLIVITKGDLFDQEAKVARSGLTERFERVEIVSEKNEATYRRIFGDLDVAPHRVTMVGNSVPSDVLPAVAAGAGAVHIPYRLTWALEADPTVGESPFPVLERLADLPDFLGLLG